MKIVEFCVKRPVAILMAYLAIVLIGIISLTRLPVELMPNYSLGDISIFVNIRGGMPPQEVENMVARPIEEAVGDVTHLRDIISISEEGRCRVAMRFEPGVNMDYAAIEVREKMASIKDKFPRECERPVIAKFEQSDAPVLIVALAGPGYTPEKLRKLVDDGIKDRLMRIEGVANVEVGGGRERKIMVDVDEAAIKARNIPMSAVVNALGAGNLNLLVGEHSDENKRYLLRVTGQFENIQDIKNIAVSSSESGSLVRLRDIAKVEDSYLEPSSFARVNNLQVVSLYIQKETNANTIKVCDRVLSELKKVDKDLGLESLGIKFVLTYNQAEAIKRAIDSVKNSLLLGAILATLVLFLFLRDFKSILVIFVTIPVSVIAAFAMMYLSPQTITLNIMTLSGLALGVGMLVDSSVVVIENIIQTNQKGMPIGKAIIEGANEMMLAIIASTMTNVVVFIPIAFVNNEIRIIYAGFALTVVFSLVASLVAAITLVPVMYAQLVKKFAVREAPVNAVKGIHRAYRKILAQALRVRVFVVGLVAVFFVIAILVLAFFVPKEFIGSAQEEDFTVFVELPTGAKLDISNHAVHDIEKILGENKNIKTFSSRIEPWSSKIYVKLVSAKERSQSIAQIIEKLRNPVKEVENRYKEAFIYFEQPQSVETNEIITEIYGYDYDTLSNLAVKMISAAEKVKGLKDLKIRWRKGRPEWRIIVSRERAALFGLTVEDVAQTLHSQIRGLRATLFHTQGKEIEVVSRFEEGSRNTLDKLKRLPIELKGGTTIYLEQIADFTPQMAPGKIWRKNKQRMIQISADRGIYSFGQAAAKMQQAFKEVDMPKDYYYQFGENYWRMIENQRQLIFAVLVMLVLVFLVLASLFESYRKPLIIMTAVPMAVIGAVLFLLLFKKAVNIGVLMGFIILGGIVVNNAIVMMDHITHLEEKFNFLKALMRGAADRLRPVLITSITAVLGMMPLIFDKSEEAAMWSPLAVTVTGGLISSTILTLFVIPCIYALSRDISAMARDWRTRKK